MKILDGEGIKYEKAHFAPDAVRVSNLGLFVKKQTFFGRIVLCSGFVKYACVQNSCTEKKVLPFWIFAPRRAENRRTLHSLCKNSGEIYSSDIYEHKIKLISQNAKRLGIEKIKPWINDATAENEGYFDKFDFCSCRPAVFGSWDSEQKARD
ncbi:MAG: hypothetical protein L6V93_11015 [Clostridiales bacterium]|nr:MAG: hypothetical protein L6V93_11015 [Clostridiales bacterium]